MQGFNTRTSNQIVNYGTQICRNIWRTEVNVPCREFTYLLWYVTSCHMLFNVSIFCYIEDLSQGHLIRSSDGSDRCKISTWLLTVRLFDAHTHYCSMCSITNILEVQQKPQRVKRDFKKIKPISAHDVGIDSSKGSQQRGTTEVWEQQWIDDI